MAKEFSSKMETKIKEATKKYGLVKSIEVQDMGDDLVLVGYDKNDEVVRVKVGTVKEEYGNGISDKESRRELGNKRYGSEIENSTDMYGEPLATGDQVLIDGTGNPITVIELFRDGTVRLKDGTKIQTMELKKV
jgi:hypothetical protein